MSVLGFICRSVHVHLQYSPGCTSVMLYAVFVTCVHCGGLQSSRSVQRMTSVGLGGHPVLVVYARLIPNYKLLQ